MENLAEIVALLALFVGLAGPAVTLWKNRKTTGSEISLTSAETVDKLTASVDRQETRLESQRDEIDELRGRIKVLEDDSAERDRIINKQETRIVSLEDEVTTLTKYLRRVINQLRKAGIVPDLPPAVIEQLFKGTE